jgi:hypothetical protein
MDYYHGTTIPGLQELRPYASPYANLNEPVVYLTTSQQLALHYIWDTNRLAIKMPMLDIRKDGVLVFQEMFPGALEFFYKGVSGYIYHCVGDYAPNEATREFTCATSHTPVAITDSEYVDDVYSKILEYAHHGTFIYEHFESLPQYRYDLIRGIIMRIIKKRTCYRMRHIPIVHFFERNFRSTGKKPSYYMHTNCYNTFDVHCCMSCVVLSWNNLEGICLTERLCADTLTRHTGQHT